ncbi:MAG: c-type cytochrome [Paracoccaceae bacterium]|nr:c-type cytochrome [Paracoccaceae bacterium]
MKSGTEIQIPAPSVHRNIRSALRLSLLTAVVAVALPGQILALDLDDPLVAAGKVLFEETAGGVGCAACHGMEGAGDPDLGAPYIRGVARAAFKSAIGGAVPVMEFLDLNQKEQKEVFAYLQFLGQPTPVLMDPIAQAGKEIFEKTAGGVGCASCHGEAALGDIGIGPNIRGKDSVTILKQLQVNEKMKFIHLEPDEVDQVSAYLRYLHDQEAH